MGSCGEQQLPRLALASLHHAPSPCFFPSFALLQEGALAYGLKLDDRVRVLPNAKLRASREWLAGTLLLC